ncbi:carbohydrate sulfotransferase 11-like isoform X2 [Cherax quadricarinatus]|uniref:carbohydrate sulfotransferase 11-like isoform X2 n=1 Tax=Cherax quadricarinatus TaxID=27406 RepID=UPI00387E3DC1
MRNQWTMVASVLLLLWMLSLTLRQQQISPGWWERSQKLRQRVRHTCTSFNVSSEVTQRHLRNIYVDDTRGVLYCSVHKVASSTWKRVWLKMTSSTAAVSNTTTRHPLRRVVSAYRDKLYAPSDMEDMDISAHIKKTLTQKFGTSSTHTKDDVVSFADYIRLITHQEDDEDISWDGHWRPIHQMCNPCGIDYDFIGKFENLHEDMNHVLQWLGVDKIVRELPVPMKNTGADHLASFYLKNLSSSLRKSFLAHYFLDYLSFEYEFI